MSVDVRPFLYARGVRRGRRGYLASRNAAGEQRVKVVDMPREDKHAYMCTDKKSGEC